MATNEETPELGTFGIQESFDLGVGSQELIEGLLSPETSLESPDEIEKIEKPVPPTQKKETKPTQKKEEKEEEPEEKKPPVSPLSDFLGKEKEEGEEGSEEEEEPSEDPSQEKAEKKSQETNSYTALAQDLIRLGVFSPEEGEEEGVTSVTNGESLLQRFNEEKRKGAFEMLDNFLGQFGEDYRSAFEAIYVKGVNPKEYFGIYNNIVSFAELDLSDEGNQIAVIKAGLREQGFEEEDVTTEVERLKNYGDLEDVSKRYHKVLVKKEAKKLQEAEENATRTQQLKAQMKEQFVHNVQTVLQEKLKTKEFDGIPINPKIANELQDFLLVDKYKTASGETLTEFDRVILELKRPENHATKVKVALLLKLLEKDPTLSTIQRVGITKKSDELFSSVARHTDKPKPTSNSKKDQEGFSWFNQ